MISKPVSSVNELGSLVQSFATFVTPELAVNEPLWYRVYGFAVRSEIPLPIPPIAGPTPAEAAWSIRRSCGVPPPEPDWDVITNLRRADGAPLRIVRRGPGGSWIWDHQFGVCLVSPDARMVEVFSGDDDLDHLLGISLVGQLATYVLHRLGHSTLHASAVQTEQGAVAFLGRVGQGKSSMAAAFLRRGASLVTDDIMLLSERDGLVLAGPGLPLLKLWPEAADGALAVSDVESLPRVLPPRFDVGFDKKLLKLDNRFPFVEEPVALRAVYVLDRYSPVPEAEPTVTITRLGGQEGLVHLMSQISFGSFLRPDEVGRFMSVYAKLARQAPVRSLRFPTGFAFHETAYQEVLADIAGCS